jgi:hypothetical protein
VNAARIRGRLEALILLTVGLGAGSFALLGDYTRLMNPRFRWVAEPGLLEFASIAIGHPTGHG